MNNNAVDLLNGIKKQIERFDSKANILAAISGILLGMSFGWIPQFKIILNSSMIIIKYFLFVFIIFYLFSLSLAILFFIWAILPRNKPKKFNKIATNVSSLYYKDLQKMNVSDIKEELLSLNKNNLSEQIKINSGIASKKHNLLAWGIFFLFLSIVSIFGSILFYIFI